MLTELGAASISKGAHQRRSFLSGTALGDGGGCQWWPGCSCRLPLLLLACHMSGRPFLQQWLHNYALLGSVRW